MARKKSIQDLIAQQNRIRDNALRYADTIGMESANRHYNAAMRIASRYAGNIGRSKQFSKDDRTKGWEAATNRKYSQRTYMGLNEG